MKLIGLCIFLTANLLYAGSYVNQSTGTLHFTETIASARSNGLSLPINLSYSSRTTKNQRASWVGWGFDLDVPYIERTVLGGPDDCSGHTDPELWEINPWKETEFSFLKPDNPGKLYSMFYTFQPLIGRRYGPIGNPDAHTTFPKWYTTYHGAPQPANQGECTFTMGIAGYLESEVRLYCGTLQNQTLQDRLDLHNFPNGDCQIFFSDSRSGGWPASASDSHYIGTDPYKPWKIHCRIKPGASRIAGWVVVDADGTKWTFDRIVEMGWGNRPFNNAHVRVDYFKNDSGEITDRYHTYTAVERYADPEMRTGWRWYLTRVESYDGDWIEVDYDRVDKLKFELDEDPYFTGDLKGVDDSKEKGRFRLLCGWTPHVVFRPFCIVNCHLTDVWDRYPSHHSGNI